MFCACGNCCDFPSRAAHHCTVCKDLKAWRGFFAALRSSGQYLLSLSSLAKGCHINGRMKASDCFLHCIEHGDKTPWLPARSFYKQVKELSTTLASPAAPESTILFPGLLCFPPRVVFLPMWTLKESLCSFTWEKAVKMQPRVCIMLTHTENPAKLWGYWCFTSPKLMN